MAKEFKLEAKGSSIWWLDVSSATKGMKEIKYDLDAMNMALSVDSSKEIYVYFKIGSGVIDHGVGLSANIDEGAAMGQTKADEMENLEEEEMNEEDSDLEGILLGIDGKGKKNEEESDLHDSDYSFGDELEEAMGTNEPPRAKVVVHNVEEEHSRVVDEDDNETDYAGSTHHELSHTSDALTTSHDEVPPRDLVQDYNPSDK
ncbi:hypothetical protein J5N97_008486 [Dioscorea zingiberensis]|uniref:Uncharacterized protein n=1 Tax=Dioscorea zingiberensis TaxID=325984 RepID=A0A9D5CVB9_9LILI|nr:hypothetical protein J5N97_008486 [Dioscorea zingiberensis]